MNIYWKADKNEFTAVPFGFQFNPGCKFVKFINFGHGSFESERVEQ